MSKKLSPRLRRELFEKIKKLYQQARYRSKRQMLDQFVSSTGYSRKHAIQLLNHTADAEASTEPQMLGRPRIYDERVRQTLVNVWRAANRICAKRLVPFLPELVEALERHGHLSLPADVRERLLSISAATADRLLAAERQAVKRGLSTTRPGSLLKKQIKIRTFADWDDPQPGFLEADLVAHCGTTTEGSYLHTLVLVDISTGWTECVALLRRSEADVIGALEMVRQQLPFPLLGLDTDNGSEFINYEMLRYCQQERITFTRSRVNRRNDQAHVEEKNGSVVRRLIGYDRYEGVAAWRVLMQVFGILRLYLNLFQPSMKLVSKKRIGARVIKKYDQARTPCQRLISGGTIGKPVKDRLRQLSRELDPLALLRELEQAQDRFWKFANLQAETDPIDSTTEVNPFPAGDSAKPGESFATTGPRRYRRTKKAPVPRTWRTRKDPFAEAWKEVRLRLEINPAQTAKALFRDLQERYPGRFQDGQLRTLQRRVREWRRSQLYVLEEHCLDSASTQPASENSKMFSELTGAGGHSGEVLDPGRR